MLKAHRPASVISFPKSARPHLAAWLAGVPLRLGCGDGGVRLLTTHQVMFYRSEAPFVDRYRGVVAEAFPHLPEPAFRPFRPRAEALQAAERARAEAGLRDYVVFAPGANSWSKRLAPASFITLGRRLAAEGIGVVILGGAGPDQALASELRAGLSQALDLTGRCGLALSAAWICGARALVGMDSGLAHISAGAGIPTLSVFGPTRPHHSAPWGPRVSVLRREDLACLECMEGACPVPGHPCMTQVPDADLWAALRSLLQ
jgi:ADP-heptose:LPS heptosyltransferase